MGTNRQTLDHLFETQQIDVRRGFIFDVSLPPMPEEFDFDRVEGMMLELAIGDAIGVTTEGMLPEQRSSIYGEIRDYIPNRYVNESIGFPSDDTQLAFWTLEQVIADTGFNPERTAARFCRGKIFGIGSTVKRFIRNYKSGIPWHKCGPKSAGNGALMRIVPIVIPHLKSGTSDLWVDTALSAMITHNDSGSIAACLSFINMIWHLLKMNVPPEPNWWLETYVDIAKDLEVDDTYRPRGGAFLEYQGPIWRFVLEKVGAAIDACRYLGALLVGSVNGASKEELLLEHYSPVSGYWEENPLVPEIDEIATGSFKRRQPPEIQGTGYVVKSLEAGLWAFYHSGSFREGCLLAVNLGNDADTTGAVFGQLAGIFYGEGGIPKSWRAKLAHRHLIESFAEQLFALSERL